MPHVEDKMIELAESRIGEVFDLGADVPLNDPNWHGPWDCAEFTSWIVYQVLGLTFGCADNGASIGKLEPYSMSWYRDAMTSPNKISISTAKTTKGAFLVRKEEHGKRGHVAMSDGAGGTIEAHSADRGVMKGSIDGRKWHVAVIVG